MPLKKGSSSKTISKNISELMRSFKKKGKIGNFKPKTKKKALKQSIAIALSSAGKTRSNESFKHLVFSVLSEPI